MSLPPALADKPPHVCKPWVGCKCYIGADAPDDGCPIHGGGVADRCECGRFVSLRRDKAHD